MKLSDYVEEFLLYIGSVKGLSENSLLAYTNDLSHLLLFLGDEKLLGDITTEDIRMCVAGLSKEKKATSSINRFISAVKSFFSYCRKFEYVQVNVCDSIKSVKNPKLLPKFLTVNEVDELCSAPVENPLLWKTRDAAIFEMLYSSGCRVSELASLKFSDLTEDFSSAIVLGKGSKERRVYFAKEARSAFLEYLKERKIFFEEKKIADTVPEIFVNQKGAALTSHGIRWILARYSGVEGTNHPISPHALRHTFATTLVSNGADVRVVQELLGHANISTTQRYTHITTQKLIDIYNNAHPHGNRN